MISFPPIALVDGLQRHAPVAHSYPVGADEHPADESPVWRRWNWPGVAATAMLIGFLLRML
jgi:hypothetical protein